MFDIQKKAGRRCGAVWLSYALVLPLLFGEDWGEVSAQSITNTNILYITSGTTFFMGGNFTNNSGATTEDQGTLQLAGNWTNNGTFTPGTGSVIFSGSSAQTIQGNNKFYDLIIDNSHASGVSIISGTDSLIRTLTLTNGTFTTNNTFTLISDAGGTARIAQITGGDITGDITMQRYINAGNTHWRFLCSAVNGATVADWAADFATAGFPGSDCSWCSDTSVYTYTETEKGVSDLGWRGATNATNSIGVGQGFSVWCGDTLGSTTPFLVDLTGPSNKFSVTIPVSYTASSPSLPNDDGWNLVGNPYPSAIDWNVAGWTKTNMDNAIYVWDPDAEVYASYVGGVGANGGSQYVPSSQAFWVKANAVSPVLAVTEPVKSSVDQAFFKVTGKISNLFRLKILGAGYADEAVIRFTPGATPAFDNDYDAYKVTYVYSPSPNISTVIEDSIDLSINSLPELISSVILPVRVTVNTSGNYTVYIEGIDDMPVDWCILLEDLLTDTFTDLRADSAYSFVISDTTYAPRFLLHLVDSNTISCYDYINSQGNPSAITTFDNEPKNQIQVLQTPDGTYIKFTLTQRAQANIAVYNLMGQKVINDITFQVMNDKIKLDMPFVSTGVYLIKIEANNYVVSEKLVY
ncbi:MAG: hypothetical protein COC01_09000 [Bacteroidetes bacterium]|nr:MAG: hypothetical protein COC01_09000 [Bacteroidota bacterium]